MLLDYIPPVEKYKYKLPRKEKKAFIKEFGREAYYELVNVDFWEIEKWRNIFSEMYNEEMIHRRNYLRKYKLKRLCGFGQKTSGE